MAVPIPEKGEDPEEAEAQRTEGKQRQLQDIQRIISYGLYPADSDILNAAHAGVEKLEAELK